MTDPTGIEQEEMATQMDYEILTSPITFLGEDSKSVKITGVALTEGCWKNVIYSASEIKKVAETLLGRPLLVEHGNTKEFGNREVGKVTKSYFEPTLKALIFEAEITDTFAKNLVKKGVLPAVSCSTWMEKKAINDQIRVGTDYNFAELSLVRVPACDRCFIFHKEQLSKLPQGKDLKVIEEKELFKGEYRLTEQEIETLSEVEEEEQEQVELEQLEAPKLYAVLELPDQESLESLRKVKRVVSYYYGYPYGAPYYYGYGYPYRDYPYKGYPYKYPYKGAKKLSEETPILLAVVELTTKEELEELRKTYKIGKYYYGQYGYPYRPYGYGYGYPYKYKYKYAYPRKLSSEELAVFHRVVGEPAKEQPITAPKERQEGELITGEKMPHQTGAPNPEQCAEIECPVCGKKFPDEKTFMDHWDKEHKEQYGDFKETATILDALSKMVDLAKGDTKIVKMKNGRFVVFVDTGKEGFGQWKIAGNFATEAEAKKAAAEKKSTEEPKKDEHGCIIGQEEWCEDTKKCIPIEKAAEKIKCPACKKEFATEKELADHWAKEHAEEYGKIYKGYKEPEKKAKAYYYYKYKGKYCPYYYGKGKYFTKYKYPVPKKK